MVNDKALDVDALAQEIRRVDGSNSLGAGALAEALMPYLTAAKEVGEPGWQDISTAPKDALVLLSCDNWEPSLRDGRDLPVKVGGYWAARWNVFGASWKPTHWRPLPSPPASKGGEE